MSRRAGRKRRFGHRTASGHTSGHLQLEQRTVGPTPELLLRRILLVGPDGDLTKASAAIDLLHVHGMIGEDEVRAARWFGRLFVMLFGSSLPRCTLGNEGERTVSSAAIVETRMDREAARDYDKAVRGIKTKDRGLLIEVIVLDAFPHPSTMRPTLCALADLTRNYLGRS